MLFFNNYMLDDCSLSSQQRCRLTWSPFTRIYRAISLLQLLTILLPLIRDNKRRKRPSPPLWDVYCTKVRGIRFDFMDTLISRLNYWSITMLLTGSISTLTIMYKVVLVVHFGTLVDFLYLLCKITI